ncbi:primase alpha helix C-terminal domain-containing protein [Lignipirellula cremea]|uniref:Primase C-terminal 1 domain-containing protein n=1 Tax=Lignipirellula cremea TaxID=2528010 RepID=A0A518DQL1_9BACT|nr:primase C-terminal domain-containing protein [Lignipirellula cremea]QDU94126.1 hypothetical protein Pla8534_19120 [Lignipirellula cremea]
MTTDAPTQPVAKFATQQSAASAWMANASDLASWVSTYFVNRSDVFGRYYYASLETVSPGDQIPVKQRTVHGELTQEVIQRHFRAWDASNLIGVHCVSPEDACRWFEIDIDQHTFGNNEIAWRNLYAARRWYVRLHDLGFEPLLWHSNGKGGFRLNVRFAEPLVCREARNFGLWAVQDWKDFGLPSIPEVFPKQASIHETEMGVGNFVRLPGRHPKRRWYPEVFDGSCWLRGEEAVRYILSLSAQPTSFVPHEATNYAPAKRRKPNRVGTGFYTPNVFCGEGVVARAAAILSDWRLPDIGDRNATLFRAGCVIGERLPISSEDHLTALSDFNVRFEEPLSNAEVSSVARSSFDRTEASRGRIVYSPAVVEEILPPDDGLIVGLEEYRRILATKYDALLGRPGLYLDMTPVGIGKTHQGARLAGSCESSLHVIPTHQTKDDLVGKLVTVGSIAVERVAAFPERTSENCRKMEQAAQHYKFGIVVPSALCSTCEFQTDCPHVSERQRAEAAPHTVGTMARMEGGSLARVGANRGLIRIDEDSLNLLRPTVKTSISAVRRFTLAVEAAIDFERRITDADVSACVPFLVKMKASCEEIAAAAERADADEAIPVEDGLPIPKMLEFVLKKGFDLSGLESKTGDLAAAKKVLVGLVSGELRRCVIQVWTDDSKGREEAVVGVWQTELPVDKNGSLNTTVLLSDATADSTLLRRVLGKELIDITPAVTVRRQRRVVQVPLDVKRSTTSGSFLKILRGLLLAFPDKRRVGVISHRPHVQAIADLGATLRARIVKFSYFGSGEDRASNEWLEEGLDLLLVVGTPRISPADIRTRMIQFGVEAHAPARSEWKKRYWRGRTETGEFVDVVTRCYDDPTWQQTYEYDVQATLNQALGRARSILSEGMDAVVVTCEPLQLPLYDESLIEASDVVEEALDLFAKPSFSQDALNWQVLAEQLHLKQRTAKALLNELLCLGIVVKEKKGKYRLHKNWSSISILTYASENATSAPQPQSLI